MSLEQSVQSLSWEEPAGELFNHFSRRGAKILKDEIPERFAVQSRLRNVQRYIVLKNVH